MCMDRDCSGERSRRKDKREEGMEAPLLRRESESERSEERCGAMVV